MSDFEISEQYQIRKAAMLRRLTKIADSGLYQRTVYLSPESLGRLRDRGVETRVIEDLPAILKHLGKLDTGVALFWHENEVLAILPPFPLTKDISTEGTDVSTLVRLLTSELLVGIVLLRLGRYAVGVLQGERLVASKIGTRHVKNRHRAGGSSQHRFERSRERLIRELFDAACGIARDLFAPFSGHLDYLLLSGEKHTLQSFVRRCQVLQRLDSITLGMHPPVDRPGQKAMLSIYSKVWTSHIIVFRRPTSE